MSVPVSLLRVSYRFDSGRGCQKEKHGQGRVFFFGQGNRTRREQAKPAEENSPVDSFRRRGNERSEAIARQRGTNSHRGCHEKSTCVGKCFFHEIRSVRNELNSVAVEPFCFISERMNGQSLQHFVPCY